MGGDERKTTHERSFQVKEVMSGDNSSATSSCGSLPVPPDGGWGWVVCGAAFFCMVILDGMMFSFGVMNLELLHYFQESKGRTAMVGSALMGTHLMLGPVVSAMVNCWGIRKVTMAGGLVAGIAFALSTMSPCISVLIVIYGVMGGVGVSMIYLPSLLAVGFYFEKRRALANGITSSGSGIGAFLYSPLTNILQGYYGWKGALLILSGLVLNCAPCGALYRPLLVRMKRSVSYLHVCEESPPSIKSPPTPVPPPAKTPFSRADDLHRLVLSKNAQQFDILKDLKSYSMDGINQPRNEVPQQIEEQYASSDENSDSDDCVDSSSDISPNGNLLQIPQTEKQTSVSTDNVYPSTIRVRTTSNNTIRSCGSSLKPLSRKDLYYSGSLLRIPEYRSNPSVRSLTVNLHEENTTWNGRTGWMATIDRLIGLSLLRTPVFLLLVGMGVLWTTHSTVLTILPHQAVLQGISNSRAALLLSIIGVTNTCGRILAGWISDRPEVDVLWVNIIALFLGGAVCVVIPFTASYALLCLQAAIFGLCMATWTSLRPILLVEMLGLDNLTNAFGLMAMFQGVAFLFGPPLAGMLYDITSSYTMPFLMCSAAFITSGLLCLPMRRVATCRCWSNDIDIDIEG